jgi:hypothetical protein
METLTTWKGELFAALSATLAFVVWLLKLENGTKKNAEGIRGLHKLRSEDAAVATRQRAEDFQSSRDARKVTNDRLERMETDMREIGRDIKTLLSSKAG